jgi:hypothetical protein
MKHELGYDRDFRRNMQAVADFFKFGKVEWSQWFDTSILQAVAPEKVEAD